MKILHTEASPGWGGQERRILNEAIGMRQRGHQIFFAVAKGSSLGQEAKKEGFEVVYLSYKKFSWWKTALLLFILIHRKKISVVNTHSSLDSWIAGSIARLCRCRVIRTRHISNPVLAGLNASVLYRLIPHVVVTTCEEMATGIRLAIGVSSDRCLSVPTGIDPASIEINVEAVRRYREQYKISESDIVVGTTCILRGWKGVADFLEAAYLLKDRPNLKWLIVGDGPSKEYFLSLWEKWGLQKSVIFTGYIPHPYALMSMMNIFTLLSYQHEGVSQAILQAAWLEKPLISTPTGGLKEVCIHEKTGFVVPPCSPQKVAQAVMRLALDPNLRLKMGKESKALVQGRFLFSNMVEAMERVSQRD